MIIYILRRLLLAVVTLAILTLVGFFLLYYSYGSEIHQLPLYKAYPLYLVDLFQGNLGVSRLNGHAILAEIKTVLPVTLELCILAIVVALVIGIPLGIIAGVYNKRWPDRTLTAIALLGLSVPTFWLSLLLIAFFSYYLGWLPDSGRYDHLYVIPSRSGFILIDTLLSHSPQRGAILLSILNHMLLPVFALSIPPMMEIIRLLRLSVINVSEQNYVKAAATRGLTRFTIVYRHILHNAIPPIIPKLGFQLSTMLMLAMVVEIIFEWPGIGNWLVYALRHQDYPAISGGIMVISGLVIVANLVADIIGVASNPLKHKELYVLR